MPRISHDWKRWIDRYIADGSYWYVPKGRSISDIETIQQQLRVLAQLEGKKWRQAQRPYINKLIRENLSEARARDDDRKGIPMARMLAKVFELLGFAWVNEDEAIVLTPAGEKFIASTDPEAVVARQSKRYQVSNPIFGMSSTKGVQIHPVPYLLEILLQTKTLTKLEYVLFCAKAKSYGDVDDTIEGIKKWRNIGPRYQQTIIKTLEQTTISKPPNRRKSIYNTVNLNAPYALAFWTASKLIQSIHRDGETFYKVARGKYSEVRSLVKQSQRDGQYIFFESAKDWVAFYGDPEKAHTKMSALSYYSDVADFDRVRAVLDEMRGYTSREKQKYIELIVEEKTVEDILESNIELVEPGMRLLERQKQTEIGRIDLFARDKEGVYTIIELKKGRTDDRVFGQLSRYMGWCKKVKSRSSQVRGIIIAKTIGEKLWAAADGHDTPVELMEYDLKMSLDKAQRSIF